MTTRSARPWIKVDVGLLDDERFVGMPLAIRGVWITAYLVVARDGDSCRDRARLAWLLGRDGVSRPEKAVADLDGAGWIEDRGDGTITIRHFDEYQPIYRGPSDLPEAKAERNAKRSTTRAGRSSDSAATWSERGARGATEERRGEEIVAPPPAGAGAGGREGTTTRLGDFLKKKPGGGFEVAAPIHGQPEAVVE